MTTSQLQQPPQVVLIAIDASESAERAFDWYVYHLHRKGTKVILAHYIDAEKEKELRKKEAELVELQEMYENRLLQLKIEYEWVNGVSCGPAEHLLKTAERTKAEMIVMGARGLSKLKKVVMDSVSDEVLRRSLVPVLVCRKGTVETVHNNMEDVATARELETQDFEQFQLPKGSKMAQVANALVASGTIKR